MYSVKLKRKKGVCIYITVKKYKKLTILVLSLFFFLKLVVPVKNMNELSIENILKFDVHINGNGDEL